MCVMAIMAVMSHHVQPPYDQDQSRSNLMAEVLEKRTRGRETSGNYVGKRIVIPRANYIAFYATQSEYMSTGGMEGTLARH